MIHQVIDSTHLSFYSLFLVHLCVIVQRPKTMCYNQGDHFVYIIDNFIFMIIKTLIKRSIRLCVSLSYAKQNPSLHVYYS